MKEAASRHSEEGEDENGVGEETAEYAECQRRKALYCAGDLVSGWVVGRLDWRRVGVSPKCQRWNVRVVNYNLCFSFDRSTKDVEPDGRRLGGHAGLSERRLGCATHLVFAREPYSAP